MNGALLVAGTHSDAGKSVVVAGICRWLAREGVKVAPFKAQNMALNSFVTREGAEIGRAQAAQAAAAMVEPEAAMNPVLLKPSAERTTQVVVRGKPWATASATSYGGMKRDLMPVVLESLEDLRRRFDVVVCEGAGSPAEINLRENDLANMGLARAAGLPVLLVGDIDRGGLFASLYGTLALLSPEDQALLAGFLVNKFRGDPAVLAPGLARMTSLTGRPFLGTLPWIPGLGLDGEDSLALDAPRPVKPPLGRDVLSVAVARLGRISNFTDFDALAHEPGVSVRFTTSAEEILDADLAVIPGTKATVDDLKLLRSRGLDVPSPRGRGAACPPSASVAATRCSAGASKTAWRAARREATGLGLLPVETSFEEEKILGRPEGRAPGFGDAEVSGYEIHHGRIRQSGGEPLFASGDDAEGCRVGATLGTSWHGVLESDDFRRAFLAWVAAERNLDWRPGEQSFAAAREAQLEKLGDLVADNVDREALMRLIDGGPPRGCRSSALSFQASALSKSSTTVRSYAEASRRRRRWSGASPSAFATMSGGEREAKLMADRLKADRAAEAWPASSAYHRGHRDPGRRQGLGAPARRLPRSQVRQPGHAGGPGVVLRHGTAWGQGSCWCGCWAGAGRGPRVSRSCGGAAGGSAFRCWPSAGRPSRMRSLRRSRPRLRGPCWRPSSTCVTAGWATRRTCSASSPTPFSWRATGSSRPRRCQRSASTIRGCPKVLRSKSCSRSTTPRGPRWV